MPPAIPKTPERKEVKTMVAPMRARMEGAIADDYADLASAPSIMSIVLLSP